MPLAYKGDIGARLTISTSNTAIPSGTTLTVIIKKPSGTLLTKTPSVNLTTGVLTYDTVSGDLDETGEYKVQVHGVFVDGDDLYSDRDSFTVYEKLT
jgi:hypothetical protein